MYSSVDPRASQYVLRFSAEAGGHWSDDESQDSILNLASLQLLSLGYLGYGDDHHGLRYLTQASDMGTRMGLFGVDPSVAAKKLAYLPQELREPTAFAAWGTFNWLV